MVCCHHGRYSTQHQMGNDIYTHRLFHLHALDTEAEQEEVVQEHSTESDDHDYATARSLTHIYPGPVNPHAAGSQRHDNSSSVDTSGSNAHDADGHAETRVRAQYMPVQDDADLVELTLERVPPAKWGLIMHGADGMIVLREEPPEGSAAYAHRDVLQEGTRIVTVNGQRALRKMQLRPHFEVCWCMHM